MRILVAEDEPDMNHLLKKKLKAEGFSVDTCFNGEEALCYLKKTVYDLVLLDIMMPVKDGYEVVKEMRSHQLQTPVIFLTAKDTIDDKVTGLDLGANDYMVKPFSLRELMARIRVLTRQTVQNTSHIFTIADLTLNTQTHTVMRNGQKISLTAREFSLLEVLIRSKGMVLTREQIENALWNYNYEGGTNVIDVYIRYLRRKIDEPFETKLIQTIRGVGYCLKESE